MVLRDVGPSAEMAAFDALPRVVREAIRESPFSLSASDALPGYRMGYPGEVIARMIHDAEEELADAIATAPGVRRRGDRLQLYPRPRRRKVWGRDPV